MSSIVGTKNTLMQLGKTIDGWTESKLYQFMLKKLRETPQELK